MKFDRDSVEKFLPDNIAMSCAAGIIEALTDGIHNLPHENQALFIRLVFLL